jgi:hypothetical protein
METATDKSHSRRLTLTANAIATALMPVTHTIRIQPK